MPSQANGYTRSKIVRNARGIDWPADAVEAVAASDEVARQLELLAAVR